MAEDLTDNARPMYLRIADELRRQYEPGRKLASTPNLAAEWGVARETIRAAINVLRAEDLVSSWSGRGVFYRSKPTEDNAEADHNDVTTRLDALMDRLGDLDARVSALEQQFRDTDG